MPFVFDDTQCNIAQIKVIGLGGGGCNAVNNMIEADVQGVEFISANTDLQSLHRSRAAVKIQLGPKLCKGLGCGAKPDVGRQAALESQVQLSEVMEGADMVFITAGLGGGTGTGSAPVVADIAREMGILSVAVVTKPFLFEGSPRMRAAEQGFSDLKDRVDAFIVIPNQRILTVADKSTSCLSGFKIADDVLRQAVQGISDLITVPGRINRDFADLRNTMALAGRTVMGVGMGSGENRAMDATNRAINSPLLEHGSIEGARGVILNFTGGRELGIVEMAEAAGMVMKAVHEDALILWGMVMDESMGDDLKVTVIATGFQQRAEERGLDEPEAPRNLTTIPVRMRERWPAFIRQKAVGAEHLAEPEFPLDKEDLDYPTFLRVRQPD
jgi:cell division protein FtsZ